ncbi:LacI family DNA-binding transcriptional regulator [Gorillibacterium massiliense]|uniref:LacI family DNA-binding transcriptional regulator n=1 Tax=Gorillibacterium massiliense TaxID=1280390 RepID=UPI0004B32C29|nr:LacI family DNA-binding transcriptional regulator [Gorillibacterium massiliense]
MVTIYDIASKAGVSAMTVSRVINNTGRISEKTRAKVRRVMEDLNYVPNQTARSLVLQETRILFLLITDIANPFYTTVARGAEDAARHYGYRLFFGNSDENIEKEQEYVQVILSTRADGVLIAPAGDPSRDNLETLGKHRVPLVLLDREVPGIACDVVMGDSKEGARQLVEHLAAHGHRRIAMINGSPSISSARSRLQGFQEALALLGLPAFPGNIYETSFGPTQQLADAEAWLSAMDPLPTAIVAGNNVLAVELIRLLRARDIRVPEDISVVCFDDLGPYSEVDPFVTVVAQQAYQYGYLGIELLVERLRQGDEPEPWKRIVLPTELLVRRSVSTVGE